MVDANGHEIKVGDYCLIWTTKRIGQIIANPGFADYVAGYVKIKLVCKTQFFKVGTILTISPYEVFYLSKEDAIERILEF